MPPTNESLDRFHRVLLQEISESRPEYLTKPFTVAEIYQNLVPYRSHRDLIGVEMNGDYEDILLRLLAGEGDYLLLDSEVARREIQRELESPNPNTGLFRDFAAADVRLNSDRVVTGPHEPEVVDIAELSPDADDSDVSSGDTAAGEAGGDGVIGHIELADVGVLVPMPGTEADDLGSQDGDVPEIPSVPDMPAGVADDSGDSDEPLLFDEPEPSEEPESSDEPELSEELEASRDPEESGETASLVDSSEGGPSACHWCRQDLPSRELLNFCPFCGSDLRLSPCPQCGEDLELRWQFCVSCGTDVSE